MRIIYSVLVIRFILKILTNIHIYIHKLSRKIYTSKISVDVIKDYIKQNT